MVMGMPIPWILEMNLFVSGISVILLFLLRRKPEAEPASEPPPPTNLSQWKQIRQDLESLERSCTEIARSIPMFDQAPPPAAPATETPFMKELGQVLQAFQRWSQAVRRSRAFHSVYEQDLQDWEGRLSEIRDRSAKLRGQTDSRRAEELRGEAALVIARAVQLTDQDMGGNLNTDVGQALGELAKSANLKLISPKLGEPWPIRGSDKRAKVGRVLTRGLRNRDGEDILPVEFEPER